MSAASSAGRARTVLSLSEEEREHLLACPVCMELYNRTNRQPKVLPCSHTFCKECLLGIRPPLCPFDRSDYSQSDVHRYPNNSSVLLLVGPDTGGSVGDVDDASGGQANPGVSARGVVPAVAASPNNSSMYSPYQEAPHVMQPAQSTCIVINKKYYKGMPGILKFIELLSSLIAFICMSVNAQECQFNFSTLLFFKIAIMFTFVTNMLVYWSCLLSLHRTILNLSPGNTHVLAIVFYFLQVIMLFFGTYFLSIHGCEATHDAAALFGMVALLAVFVDAWRAVLLYSITDGVTVETLL